jgi:hypothetical protein
VGVGALAFKRLARRWSGNLVLTLCCIKTDFSLLFPFFSPCFLGIRCKIVLLYPVNLTAILVETLLSSWVLLCPVVSGPSDWYQCFCLPLKNLIEVIGFSNRLLSLLKKKEIYYA